MSWNYRLVKDEHGEISLSEVYYNAAGEIDGWAPYITPDFFASSMEELKAELERVQAAFIKPLLEKTPDKKLVEASTIKQ